MRINTFTFNPFGTNCYVCDDDGQAVIVDPSCMEPHEVQSVLDYVHEQGLEVRELLLTHAHIDHIFGCRPLADALEVGLRLHRDEAALLEAADYQARMFGVHIEEPPAPSGYLEAGSTLTIGSATWHLLFTPGHSPGSISFHDPDGGYVISGDVLFAGSIGRTDLMGASLPALMASIYQQILPLGDETRVLPGHGPETTVGRERLSNPFLDEGRG